MSNRPRQIPTGMPGDSHTIDWLVRSNAVLREVITRMKKEA